MKTSYDVLICGADGAGNRLYAAKSVIAQYNE